MNIDRDGKIFPEDDTGKPFNEHLFQEFCSKISQLLFKKAFLEGRKAFSSEPVSIGEVSFWIEGTQDKQGNLLNPSLNFSKTPRFWNFEKIRLELLDFEHKLFEKQNVKFL